MALDDLKETIETLRERIQAHRPYLEGYETRTRQVLIDPMLRTLGWDVGDPNSVELEYRIGRDWADYVLMGSGRPIAVIEAKALGKPLDEKETMQALNYANTAGIPYMTLTNGDHWRMLEVFKQAELEDRVLMDFQLTRDEPYVCALQALGMWRPNLASGEPKEAVAPVMIKPSHEESGPPTPEPPSTAPSIRQEAVGPSNGGQDQDGWMPLTSLELESNQKPPVYIKFPDLSEKPIGRGWVGLVASIVEYLLEIGKISAEICPIPKENNPSKHLLHTETVHPDGKSFHKPKQIGDKIWLDTNFSGKTATKATEKKYQCACWLLEEFGVNPSTIQVCTDSMKIVRNRHRS